MPFGRVATDPVRIGLVERDRSLPPRELFGRIDAGSTPVRRRWRSLTAAELATARAPPEAGRDDRRADAGAVRRRPPRGPRRPARRRSSRARPPPTERGPDRLVFILYAIPIGIVAGYLVGGAAATASARCGCAGCRSSLVGLLVQVAIFSEAVGRRGRRRRAGDLRRVDRGRARRPSCATSRSRACAFVAIGAGCNLAAIVANGGCDAGRPGARSRRSAASARATRTASCSPIRARAR